MTAKLIPTPLFPAKPTFSVSRFLCFWQGHPFGIGFLFPPASVPRGLRRSVFLPQGTQSAQRPARQPSRRISRGGREAATCVARSLPSFLCAEARRRGDTRDRGGLSQPASFFRFLGFSLPALTGSQPGQAGVSPGFRTTRLAPLHFFLPRMTQMNTPACLAGRDAELDGVGEAYSNTAFLIESLV